MHIHDNRQEMPIHDTPPKSRYSPKWFTAAFVDLPHAQRDRLFRCLLTLYRQEGSHNGLRKSSLLEQDLWSVSSASCHQGGRVGLFAIRDCLNASRFACRLFRSLDERMDLFWPPQQTCLILPRDARIIIISMRLLGEYAAECQP